MIAHGDLAFYHRFGGVKKWFYVNIRLIGGRAFLAGARRLCLVY